MTHAVAIVPAKDRVDLVAATVSALLDTGEVGEVLVVDDGSVDGTGESASKAGARVIALKSNIGKGGAVAAGVAASGAPDTYLLIDADLGDSAASASDLLTPVAEGAADMVIGILPETNRSKGFGIAKRSAALLLEEATGQKFVEPLSGQRAIRGPLLRSLTLAPRFGLELGLTIDVHVEGGRIQEVPTQFIHVPSERTLKGFAHRGAQMIDLMQASASRLGWRSTLGVTTRSLVRRSRQ